MEYRMQTKREIIPKSYGNDKESAPVVFGIRALTVAERHQCTRMSVQAGEVKIDPDLVSYFRVGVEYIRGCAVDGKEIKTADEFLALPILYNMFAEVAAEIVSFSGLLEETARKN